MNLFGRKFFCYIDKWIYYGNIKYLRLTNYTIEVSEVYQVISRILTFLVSLGITYSLCDQARKLWRTRSGKDFAPSIIIAVVANELVWLNYGVSIWEWPIIALGIANVPIAIWIVYGYIRAMRGISPLVRVNTPMPRMAGIHRVEVIDDPADQRDLWDLYKRVFEPVNRQTPVLQSLLEDDFVGALLNPRVIKFVLIGNSGPSGIAMITTDLTADPFISTAYFKEHFPNRRVYYILTIAVEESRRGEAARWLLYEMTGEVEKPDGIGVLLHSEAVNKLIPRLAQLVRPDIEGIILDREVCVCFSWKA